MSAIIPTFVVLLSYLWGFTLHKILCILCLA